MPRYYKKRRYRKRPYYKRKRRYKKKSKPRLYMSLGGFPNQKTVKLRWCETNSADVLSSSYKILHYNANNCGLPVHGNTHQPSNFDVWTRRYSRWVVIGSKITVKYIPSTDSKITPAYVGLYISDNKTELADILSNGVSSLFEKKHKVRCYALDGVNPSTRTFSINYSPRKLHGVSKKTISNDIHYSGTGDGNDDPSADPPVENAPGSKAYFQLWTSNISGNDPSNLLFNVQIDYIVRFFEFLPADDS